MAKLRIAGEYLAFLREQRKWWLVPIAIALLVLGLIVVVTQSSALAPFIYTLF